MKKWERNLSKIRIFYWIKDRIDRLKVSVLFNLTWQKEKICLYIYIYIDQPIGIRCGLLGTRKKSRKKEK